MFKAKVTGTIHTTKPEFKWQVSTGTIVSGQGTEEMTVDTVGIGGQEITTTVELSGTPPGCKGSSSRTTQVKAAPITCVRPFDGYGDIRFEDEKAHLDNFAIHLSNQPLSTGHILMSAGQETFENETVERLARARSYLVDVRDVDRNRLVTLDCGFTQELRIRLIIAPVGADPPTCEIFSSIPVDDVKFTKPRPKSPKKRP